jgi:uncharacterized RDD family membrane protein YckC
MSKLTFDKKVMILVFTTAFLGCFGEIFPILHFIQIKGHLDWIAAYLHLVKTINLTFLYNNLFVYNNFDIGITVNLLNLALYLSLIAGGILFIVSKQKESRLIRFFFSIVLIQKIITFLFYIFVPLNFKQISKATKGDFVALIVILIIISFWIYISYRVLLKFNKTKTLQLTTPENEVPGNNKFKEATRWQRFFHLIVDTTICIMIGIGFARIFGDSFVDKTMSIFGERGTSYLTLFLFRLIYYIFWESMFGATPGKFLTETRVIDIDGSKINFKKTWLRTLARYIPFEAFSFLGIAGWHDTLSQTQVVAEKRVGFYGGKYFIIIPAFLILGVSIFIGGEIYKNHKSYVKNKHEYDLNIKKIEVALNNLTIDHFIKIVERPNYYTINTIFLKVEKIKGDSILVSLLHANYRAFNADNTYESQTFYTQHKDTLRKTFLKRYLLMKSYTHNYDDYEAGRKNLTALLNDEKKFEIEDISILFVPKLIKEYVFFGKDNTISIQFRNEGWSANLIELKNIEGNIKWLNQLPQKIEHGKRNFNNCELSGTNWKPCEKYKVKVVLEDMLEQKHVYFVEGNGDEIVVSQ